MDRRRLVLLAHSVQRTGVTSHEKLYDLDASYRYVGDTRVRGLVRSAESDHYSCLYDYRDERVDNDLGLNEVNGVVKKTPHSGGSSFCAC